jgi:hypothetical protein
MRALVIDALSKGIQTGSRPLLRRALADMVVVDGVAMERESAIDRLVAEAAGARREGHRLVLFPEPADSTVGQCLRH